MEIMEQQKSNTKFDEWEDVKECTKCESWWNSQCDGPPPGVKRSCQAFKATRKVFIPEQLEETRKHLKIIDDTIFWITFAIGCIGGALIFHILVS